jgi:hypothetical protein
MERIVKDFKEFLKDNNKDEKRETKDMFIVQ